MKLNILQKLFRNCQREYKLEHKCNTWQVPYFFRNKHMIIISRIKLCASLFMQVFTNTVEPLFYGQLAYKNYLTAKIVLNMWH